MASEIPNDILLPGTMHVQGGAVGLCHNVVQFVSLAKHKHLNIVVNKDVRVADPDHPV